MSLRGQAAAMLTSCMHGCAQDASEQVEHADTKEDGYNILQTMLAVLGECPGGLKSQLSA